MELTDEQWNAIESCFPARELRRPGKRGGRPWRSARAVLDGVLWVLRTGAPWADLPDRYPPYQTCHRRFQRWIELGVMPRVLATLRAHLNEAGGVEDVEGFIDGTYVPAKKGARRSANAAPAMRPSTGSGQSEGGPSMVSLPNHHSLSLLQADPDTTLFSQTELSTLLSWGSYRQG